MDLFGQRKKELSEEEKKEIRAGVSGKEESPAGEGVLAELEGMLGNDKSIIDFVILGEPGKAAHDTRVYAILKDKDLEKVKALQKRLAGKLVLDCFPAEDIYGKIRSIRAGYSVRNARKVKDLAREKTHRILTYNLSGKTPLEKVKFSQALYGRDGRSGILGELGGSSLGKGSMMVPSESMERLKEFLDTWSVGCEEKEVIML